MHSINGYVFGNGPMITTPKGQRVRWYVMSMGTEVDLHTPRWHGNTVTVNGMRVDTVSLLPASMIVAGMVPDNPRHLALPQPRQRPHSRRHAHLLPGSSAAQMSTGRRVHTGTTRYRSYLVWITRLPAGARQRVVERSGCSATRIRRSRDPTSAPAGRLRAFASSAAAGRIRRA